MSRQSIIVASDNNFRLESTLRPTVRIETVRRSLTEAARQSSGSRSPSSGSSSQSQSAAAVWQCGHSCSRRPRSSTALWLCTDGSHSGQCYIHGHEDTCHNHCFQKADRDPWLAAHFTEQMRKEVMQRKKPPVSIDNQLASHSHIC